MSDWDRTLLYNPDDHAPEPEPECECYDGSHWREDEWGNEIRVDCGCACPKCEEF